MAPSLLMVKSAKLCKPVAQRIVLSDGETSTEWI